MINSFEDLAAIIKSCKGDASKADWHQYGQVNVQQRGDLILFSYMRECQYKKPEEWNWFEKVSRGLVMSTLGEVVARPFNKFWNYGEVLPTGKPVEITEKVDGSLGICFWYNCAWRVATRGSFDSEQAQWAQKFLYENYDLRGVQKDITLLFEIIYPDNQIVIDYKGREDLVLLGVRNNKGEADWWFPAVKHLANCYGFKTPPVYDVEDIDSLLERAKTLGHEHEGWVVRYEDGSRVKVKGAAYLELHKWIGKFTAGSGEKTVAKAIVDGVIEELAGACPKALKLELEQALFRLTNHIREYRSDVDKLWSSAPKGTRKEFALWVKERPTYLQKFLFFRYDDRLTDRIIAEYIYKLY